MGPVFELGMELGWGAALALVALVALVTARWR